MPPNRKTKELGRRQRRRIARREAERMRTGGALVALTGKALKVLSALIVKNHPVGRVFTGLSLLTTGVKKLASRRANAIEKAAENQIKPLSTNNSIPQVSAPEPERDPRGRESIDIDHRTGRGRLGLYGGRIDTRPTPRPQHRDPLEPHTGIA